jgi:serine/threonine-protein kinase
MGVVYRAVDLTLKRPVALKVLPADLESDPQRRALLLREARSAAAINHPNLAAIYEIGEHEGRTFIAMELVSGRSVRQLVSNGPLSLELARSIATQVANALERAHGAGLVHRDLKPDNVMLGDDGTVKLLDFGLAKRAVREATDTAAPLTREGAIVGTPGYMAPEQVNGQPLDARADLFSLGVLLYEMLSGSTPWRGETAMEVIVSASRDPAAPLGSLRGDVPEASASLVMQLLEKDPALRPASAGAVAAALNGQPLPHAATVDGLAQTMRSAPRKRSRWALPTIAALVVAASGATFAWRSHRGMAVTDYPLPKGNPEAQREYREGLQALRDGAIILASEAFERAATHDPSMAEAHLRAILYCSGGTFSPEHLTSAQRNRAQLSERDSTLLKVAEAMSRSRVAIDANTAAAAREVTEAFPSDAESAALYGWTLSRRGSDDLALPEFDRALKLDPSFVACEVRKVGAALRRGSLVDAEAAISRCLALNPDAAMCLDYRAQMLTAAGRCDEALAVARHVAELEPGEPDDREEIAVSLIATGAPALSVDTAEKLWISTIAAGPKRALTEQFVAFRSAALAGDFPTALNALTAYEELVRADESEAAHTEPALATMRILEEMGEPERALTAGDAFVEKMPAWHAAVPAVEAHRLRLMQTLGRISAEAYAKQWAGVVEVAKRICFAGGTDAAARNVFISALYGDGLPTLANDAKEALSELPPDNPIRDWWRGQLLFHAGLTRAAIPKLRTRVADCRRVASESLGWSVTFDLVHTQLLLGRALEQTGDKAGACAPYAAVKRLWKNAKPRSVSVETATERMKALGCPESP